MTTPNDKDQDSEPKIGRRNFLRALGIGGLAGGFGILTKRAYDNDACTGHSQCGRCMKKKACDLPLAVDYRVDQTELKKKQRETNISNSKDKKLLELLKRNKNG